MYNLNPYDNNSNEEEDLSEENNARFFLNGKESQPNLDININNNQPGFQNKNLELKEEEQKKEENKKTKMTTKEKSFAFGRKRAEDKESDFKGHGKCSEDNMMRKNKVYVMDFILKFLNHSLKNKNLEINITNNIKIDSIQEENKSENVLKETTEKENQNIKKEIIKVYIRSLKNLLLNYESWFMNKRGRSKKKKVNFKVYI